MTASLLKSQDSFPPDPPSWSCSACHRISKEVTCKEVTGGTPIPPPPGTHMDSSLIPKRYRSSPVPTQKKRLISV
jgi:hypothetical protein